VKSLVTFFQTYRGVKQHATIYSGIVVLMLFGLFLEAYMHDFNLVYITLFFVFSTAFTAGPMGVRNIGLLQSHITLSKRLFAHQEGSIDFKIFNHSNQTAWAISLHDANSHTQLPPLPSQQVTLASLPYTPTHRGGFEYQGAYLQSRYPLFTARLTRAIDRPFEGIAYPTPKGKSLASFLSTQEQHYGEEKEFDGIVNYDGSQKPSHIHWPSVAKGELSVKSFIKEDQTPQLLFDFYKAGKSDEERLSQLTLWVIECEKQQRPFGILMPRGVLLSSHKESIDEILTILALY
jgi:uncharacterized protein (DUF58 family)